MSQSKEFFTRIQHKHDVEENWNKAINFIPMQGEIIVYDKDENYSYERMKIGDGLTKIIDLPFTNSWKYIDDKPFGEEYVDFFPKTTINIDEENYEMYLPPLGLIENDTYMVDFGKDKYLCTAKSLHAAEEDGGISAIVIGNFGLVFPDQYEDSGEPFVFYDLGFEIADGVGASLMYTDFSNIPEYFCIKKEIVKQLDSKYYTSLKDMYYSEIGYGCILPTTNLYYNLDNGIPTVLSKKISINASEKYDVETDQGFFPNCYVTYINGKYYFIPENSTDYYSLFYYDSFKNSIYGFRPKKIAIYSHNAEIPVKKIDNKYLNLDWLPKRNINQIDYLLTAIDVDGIVPDNITNGYRIPDMTRRDLSDIGNKLIVEIDDKKYYNLKKYELYDYETNQIYGFIGNLKLAQDTLNKNFEIKGEDSGEPFFIRYSVPKHQAYIAFPLDNNTHNVKFYSDETIKLPLDLLPDDFTSLEDIVYVGDEDEEDGGTTIDTSLFNAAYPVGSIYMTVNPVNPASLFGGTWEPIYDRFLLAAGGSYSVGATGGEAMHTLTVDEMPAHKHGFKTIENKVAMGTNYSRFASDGTQVDSVITETGGGQPHNNMPPYLAVYMWRRTA